MGKVTVKSTSLTHKSSGVFNIGKTFDKRRALAAPAAPKNDGDVTKCMGAWVEMEVGVDGGGGGWRWRVELVVGCMLQMWSSFLYVTRIPTPMDTKWKKMM